MGVLVAGLGAAAGGAVGSLIAGPSTIPGADTSVQGITKATIKKGGKGKPDETVPQIDITQSLKWFSQAAKTQEAAYRQGLDYYEKAVSVAREQIAQGYQQSNATLKPLSYASTQATNEMMRFMGMDPLPATSGFDQQAKNLGLSTDLQQKLIDADKITDTQQRDVARTQILQQINAEKQAKITDLNTQRAQAAVDNTSGTLATGSPFSGNALVGGGNISKEQYDSMVKLGFDPGAIGSTTGSNVKISGAGANAFNEYLASRDEQIQNDKVAQLDKEKTIDAQIKAADAYSTFGTDFKNQYGNVYDKGYTGNEVTQKLEATPGYGFQMAEGTKAVERQGAAKGMLGSGNTLVELTKYGQGLAQNYFGMHMDTLGKIATLGSGATAQLANNQVNEGKDYGQLDTLIGGAGASTLSRIGDVKAQSLYAKGNLYADAAKFNASMQMTGIEGDKNRQAQLAAAGIGASSGLAQASTNQQALNYQIFQNQQGGAAYGSGTY